MASTWLATVLGAGAEVLDIISASGTLASCGPVGALASILNIRKNHWRVLTSSSIKDPSDNWVENGLQMWKQGDLLTDSHSSSGRRQGWLEWTLPRDTRHFGGESRWVCCCLGVKTREIRWVSAWASEEMVMSHTEMGKTGGGTGRVGLRALFWTC